jgi:integrase/recombinase XerD
MLLARSRHASVQSLERYARPGVDAVAQHVAGRDPAGHRRNQLMVDLKPLLLVAAHHNGSTDTADCIRRATKAGIPYAASPPPQLPAGHNPVIAGR